MNVLHETNVLSQLVIIMAHCLNLSQFVKKPIALSNSYYSKQ